jgi:beta-lysine 5,6-aminomutase beta subunit
MSGLYDLSKKDFDKSFDPRNLRAYGDTMNDGKVQLSFTLPVRNDDKGAEAAKLLCKKMGVPEPAVAFSRSLAEDFTFFVMYGSCAHSVDYTDIRVRSIETETMGMKEINAFIRDSIGRKVVVVGASTGTDAHTVGIDAILNRKGFAGHYGLERYEMIESHNLGAQVPNEKLIDYALQVNADAILVSQIVTQKDVHIQNLTEFVELLQARGLRERFIICAGGTRIGNKLAVELGFDAGFGKGSYAEHVATFVIDKLIERKSAH